MAVGFEICFPRFLSLYLFTFPLSAIHLFHTSASFTLSGWLSLPSFDIPVPCVFGPVYPESSKLERLICNAHRGCPDVERRYSQFTTQGYNRKPVLFRLDAQDRIGIGMI